MARATHSDVLWRSHDYFTHAQQRWSVKGCCEGCWPGTGLTGRLRTVSVLRSADDPSSSLMACPLVYLGRANSGKITKRWTSQDWVWPLPEVFVKWDAFYWHSPWCPHHVVAPRVFRDCHLSLDLKKIHVVVFSLAQLQNSFTTAGISADKLAREFFQRFCCLLCGQLQCMVTLSPRDPLALVFQEWIPVHLDYRQDMGPVSQQPALREWLLLASPPPLFFATRMQRDAPTNVRKIGPGIHCWGNSAHARWITQNLGNS